MKNYKLTARSNQTFVWTRDLSQFAAVFDLPNCVLRMHLRKIIGDTTIHYEFVSANGSYELPGVSGRITYNPATKLAVFAAPEADARKLIGRFYGDARIETPTNERSGLFTCDLRMDEGVTRTGADASSGGVFYFGDTVIVFGESDPSPVPLQLSTSAALAAAQIAIDAAVDQAEQNIQDFTHVVLSRSVTGSGLASGGGPLSAGNAVIDVPIATQSQAVEGLRNDVAMTPLRTADALAGIDARTSFLALTSGILGYLTVGRTDAGQIVFAVDLDGTFLAKLPISIGAANGLSLMRGDDDRYVLSFGNADGSIPIGAGLLDPSKKTVEGDLGAWKDALGRVFLLAQRDGSLAGKFVDFNNTRYATMTDLPPWTYAYRKTVEGDVLFYSDESGQFQIMAVGRDGSVSARLRDEFGSLLASKTDIADLAPLKTRVDRGLSAFGLPKDEIIAPYAMRQTRQRLRSILLAGARQISIGLQGDSWAANATYFVNLLASYLALAFGDAGPGYSSFGFVAVPDGNARSSVIAVSKLGSWTSKYGTAPLPSHSSVTSSTAGDLLAVEYFGTTDITLARLFAIATADGQARYRWNGGTWTALDLTGSGFKSVDLASIPPGAWTLQIENVSGTVEAGGLNTKTAANGVLFHKLGAAGSRTRDWAGVTTNWTAADKAIYQASLAALELDALGVLGGTNSQSAYAPTLEADYMREFLTMNMAALPDADHFLVTSPENARTNNAYPMRDYAAAHREVAYEHGIAHLDLQAGFGNSPDEYKFGTPKSWLDASLIHPSTGAAGGGVVIIDRFLELLGAH